MIVALRRRVPMAVVWAVGVAVPGSIILCVVMGIVRHRIVLQDSCMLALETL